MRAIIVSLVVLVNLLITGAYAQDVVIDGTTYVLKKQTPVVELVVGEHHRIGEVCTFSKTTFWKESATCTWTAEVQATPDGVVQMPGDQETTIMPRSEVASAFSSIAQMSFGVVCVILFGYRNKYSQSFTCFCALLSVASAVFVVVVPGDVNATAISIIAIFAAASALWAAYAVTDGGKIKNFYRCAGVYIALMITTLFLM